MLARVITTGMFRAFGLVESVPCRHREVVTVLYGLQQHWQQQQYVAVAMLHVSSWDSPSLHRSWEKCGVCSTYAGFDERVFRQQSLPVIYIQ